METATKEPKTKFTANKSEAQETMDLINERVELYQKNPNVACVFKFLQTMPSALSNIKTRVSNLNGINKIPATLEVDMDLGDGLKRHRIMYNRGDDVIEGWKKYTNRDGRFERPNNLESIVFNGDTLLIYGKTVANLNLIKYLSLVEFFYAKTTGEKLVKHQDITAFGEKAEDTSELVETVISLINSLAKTKKGMEFLIERAKDDKVNKNYKVVDALLMKDEGEKEIVKMLKNKIIRETSKFKNVFLPFGDEIKLVNAAIKAKVLDYNEESYAFQIKKGGEFIKNEVVFTIKEGDDSVKELLLLDYLKKNIGVKERIKLFMNENKK